MAACTAQGVHQGVKPVQGPGGGGTVAVILMKIKIDDFYKIIMILLKS